MIGPSYSQYRTLYPSEAKVSIPPLATFAAGGGIVISGGTSSGVLGGLTFSNSNNVSFGLNGSIITASANAGSPVSIQGSIGNVIFSNSHGVTFGGNNSTITASFSQSNQPIYFSASGGQSSVNTLTFSNANGFTFSNIGGSIIGSYTVPSTNDFLNSTATDYQRATAMTDFLGTDYTSHTHSQYLNTSQSSLFRQTSQNSQLQFTSANSNFLGTGATASFRHTSADSQLRFTSADSQLQFTSQMSDYLGTSYTTHIHTQLNQAFSAQGGSSSFQTLVFTNSNGFSFSNTGGSIWGSYTVPTVTNSSWTVSDANSSASVARLAFTNVNGVTLSLSTGAGGSHTIVGSHNAITSQSNPGFSAGAASSTYQTLSFQDSNGVSFSNNGGGIRLTHGLQFTSNTSAITSNAVNTTDARIRAIVASDATYTSGSITFRDLNGISWQSTTGQQIQITHGLQFTSNTSAITSNALNTSASRVINLIAATNNTGGGTVSLSSNISFSNANNFSFYTSAGNAIVGSFSQSVDTLKAGTGFTSAGNNIGLSGTLNTNGLSLSATVAAQTVQPGIQSIQVSNTTYSTGNVIFSNANGLSFGSSAGGAITASYTVPTQTNQTIGLYGSSQTIGQSSSNTIDARSFTIRGAGIVSVGLSGGEFIVSAVAAGAGDGVNILAAGTQTANTTGTVLFNNGNGISFGMANSSVITASYTVPTVTNSSWTVSDSATSGTVGRLAFVNSNGVTFGLSTSNNGNHSVTASVQTNYLTTAALSTQTLAFSLGGNLATTNSSQLLNGGYILAGGNGLTIQQSNNTVSFSVATNYQSQGAYITTAALSTQTLAFSLSGNTATTNSSQILNGGYALAGGNGVTLQQSNNTISFSVATNYQSQGAYLTTAAQSTQTLALSLGGNVATTNSSNITAGGYSLAGGNGVTIQQSNNTISLSVATNYQSQGAYLTTAALSTQTLAFTLAGNVATTNSSQIFNGGFSLAGGNGVTIQQSNATISLSVATSYAASNHSHGNPTLALTNLTGTTASASNGLTISLSAAAPGAAAEANAINILGANTSGNTTATGSTIGWSGINLTLSGTNVSIVNISAPATSSISAQGGLTVSTNGSTINFSVGQIFNSTIIGRAILQSQGSASLSQNSLYICPEIVHDYIQGSIIKFPVMLTYSSSAAAAQTRGFTASFAVYTRQAGGNSTALTRIYSTSYTASASQNSNGTMQYGVITGIANSTSYNTISSSSAGLNISSLIHGGREFLMPWSTILAPGEYWFGYAQSSSSAGAAGNLWNVSNLVGSSQFVNQLGAPANSSSNGVWSNLGMGAYSVTSAGWPTAISLNEIRANQYQPFFFLLNGTI